jgi:hypothetical protein
MAAMAGQTGGFHVQGSDIAQHPAVFRIHNTENLTLALVQGQQTAALKGIRTVGLVHRFETGDSKPAKTLPGRIFRELAGDHGRIVAHVQLTVLRPQAGVFEKGVRLDIRTLDQEQSIVVCHPLTGEQNLPMEHSGLFIGLVYDQPILKYADPVQLQDSRYPYNSANGNDKFCPQLHTIKLDEGTLQSKVEYSILDFSFAISLQPHRNSLVITTLRPRNYTKLQTFPTQHS